MPVPSVMPITFRPPTAAPHQNSPSVAQFASLSSVASRFTRLEISSLSGKFFQPRLGVTMTMPFSRFSGPGAPIPTPMKSERLAPVSDIVCAITCSIMPAIRSATASAPPSAKVGVVCIAISRLPSTGIAPATMFVPPRSTPTM